MIWTVVMTVCLIAEPNKCKDVPMAFAERMTGSQCSLSQPDMAKWIADNEGWQVKNWQCAPEKKIKASM